MSLGILFALLAALGWGSGDVFARRAMAYVSPGIVLVLATVIIAVGLGVLGAVVYGPGAYGDLPLRFYGLVALMAFFSYATGQGLYLLGMKHAGVTLAAPIVGASPIFAIAFAVTLGGERPSLPTLLGAFVVVAGVAVILSDRDRVLR